MFAASAFLRGPEKENVCFAGAAAPAKHTFITIWVAFGDPPVRESCPYR
jgi:hypothetical protein